MQNRLKPKKKEKIKLRLGELRLRNGNGRCWVCGSVSGVKAGRSGFAIRCRNCEERGWTNANVREYEELRRQACPATDQNT